jgi:hypothetical protein
VLNLIAGAVANSAFVEIDKNPNTEYIIEIIKKARNYRRKEIEIKTPFDNIFRMIDNLFTIRIGK